jgi:hypothetical protein
MRITVLEAGLDKGVAGDSRLPGYSTRNWADEGSIREIWISRNKAISELVLRGESELKQTTWHKETLSREIR